MSNVRTIRAPFDPSVLFKLVFLAVVAIIVMVPLLATLFGGFKSLGELRVNPFGLPRHWEWQNYADILFSARYWQLLRNSLIISTLTVALTLIVASMAAFTFAHIRFYGSSMLLSYLTLGLLFPAATAVLPLFIKVRDLGLLDTYFGVALPQTAFSLAMSVLLLRRFFKDIPYELLEAALVDGCSYIKFFRYVTLPLSRPILATVGTITFVNSWNAYLLPLVMLNTDALYPWPLGIMIYQGEYSSEWHLILAFITLTILPTIILFLLAQKHIVAGLTAGAVKG
ncbi:raffinose/stachyose/melibiose transport system permease protein [Bradyrhizobium sp. GM2.2]|jgi:raffinose/stachyose/melibiose transport system permease protein|uniref:carbohydrate ABC transporter permease n=1 Tax=Bradyrhizobium TaxID=374 RepID=UPI001FFA347D|nr:MULTISPECIES: carbohydrate ABC transporter permease [unclassified Bradyrhizobium]MCK1291203.1 carbohydrate ABC transporter permease [Bradyrhizobium sp. 30]MCK1310647.1 carbohydrate ABC transporter permease [Bradyrhizobium sp. 45]MCK1318259.1 carbohydrate ABC transporter permease [Bradyrhizobium sp. 23]MCK1348830.1 carbohydrate ABC transporter permease [Bradyrhizobium sp. CW11]MCK1436046.1 carbohydrate ABC transporter permease [Bradyrhizobium sp. 15]